MKKEAACCSFATEARTGTAHSVVSDVLAVEHENVDTAGGEALHVGDRSLAFGAGKGILNGCHVIRMPDRDQVIARVAHRAGGGALGDLVAAQPVNLLGDRHVCFKIVYVERG